MIAVIALVISLAGAPSVPMVSVPPIAFKTHTYEAKIRLKGRVSTTQVQASDAGHAKKLVQAQYGPSVTVLSVKKVD